VADWDELADYDAVTIEHLRTRGNSKWSHHDEDVLAAWVAEMDFPLAPPIRQALIDAIARHNCGYSPAALKTGLPQACAAWFGATTGFRVDPEQVHLLPDVLKGLELAIDTFSPPGSPVIVPTPAYPPFFAVAQLCGRPVIEAPMRNEGGRHTFDLEGFERALAAGARTLVVCNPHNPLGRVFSRQELLEVAEVVERRGARVVADEVHGPLVYPGAAYIPYASVSATAAEHSVTLTSASKGWNVAGLKCAQILLTSPADAEVWGALSALRTHGASSLGITANRVAFESGQEWLGQTIAYLDRNRRRLGELLGGYLPQVGYWNPEGTYLAWLDCRGLGVEQPSAFFLERARVAVNDGARFGTPGEGFVRLNFATTTAILERIVEAMAQAVRTR